MLHPLFVTLQPFLKPNETLASDFKISRIFCGRLFAMLVLFVSASFAMSAQKTDTLSVRLHYRQGKYDIDPDLSQNSSNIHRLAYFINQCDTASIRHVKILSSASPEGNTLLNQNLSENRSISACSLLETLALRDTTIFEVHSIGIDWEGLAQQLENSHIPFSAEAVKVIRTTPEWITSGGKVISGRKFKLRNLQGGLPWRIMEKEIFPDLRASDITIIYNSPQQRNIKQEVFMSSIPAIAIVSSDILIPNRENIAATANTPEVAPVWLSIKSNLLLDLGAVPELGVDIYFGGRWSVGADCFYAWWSKRDLSRIWRLQGGEIYGRCYLGKKRTSRKGWFAGVYGQILRYDFLLGKSGSLSGGSGTSFFQHPTLGAGIMAGYTLPLNRHFLLDFDLGVGYLTGKYQKYKHADGLNVWESTLTRQYFGPTKGEISLVWHIWKGGGK